MKAKTKVLVGLLVVLAMMMFASPAMAETKTGQYGESQLTWTYDTATATLTISGKGEMPQGASILYMKGLEDARQFVKKIVIEEGVTNIHQWAFAEFELLEEVSIPSTVTKIEGIAFNKCTSLQSINIPNSVTSLDDGSFSNCTNLKTVSIGSGLKTVHPLCFNGCSNLKSITVSKDNPYITADDKCIIYDKNTNEVLANPKRTDISNSIKITKGSAVNPTEITTNYYDTEPIVVESRGNYIIVYEDKEGVRTTYSTDPQLINRVEIKPGHLPDGVHHLTIEAGNKTANLKVTVQSEETSDDELPELKGYDEVTASTKQLMKTGLKVGDPINFSVERPEGAGNVKYQWQISTTTKKVGGSDVLDTTNWKDIVGQTSENFQCPATADMDLKYIRCVVETEGYTVAAAARLDKDLTQVDPTTIKLEIDAPSPITVSSENKDKYEYYSNEMATSLEVTASGGSEYTYRWQKDNIELEYEDGKKLELGYVSENDAGVYQCIVSGKNEQGDVVIGKSKKITIDVTPTPYFIIKESKSEISACYTKNLVPVIGLGTLSIKKTDIGKKDYPLTVNMTDSFPIKEIKWYSQASEGANYEQIDNSNSLSCTIPKEKIKEGALIIVQITFNDEKNKLKEPLEYKATIVASDGSSDGDSETKTKPTKDLYTMDPVKAEYTGKAQKPTITPKSGAGEVANVSYYLGDKAVNGEPTEVGVYTVKIDTKANDKYEAAEDLELGTFEIIKGKPAKDLYTMTPAEEKYDGKPHKPTITPAKGAGEVDKVYYYLDGKKITGDPTDAGTYTVKIDTKANNNYEAAKELELGTFKITDSKPTKDLYTMTPAEIEYDGKTHKPTITPAEGAGEVEKVHYYLNGKEISGEPKDIGTYVVKIDTKANDKYEAAKALEIGNFIIKEKAPEQAIAYRAHVQGVGWQPYVTNGTIAGTVGDGLRLEAMNINLQHQQYKGDIEYRSHIQNIGWEKEWKKNDTMSGTSQQSLRLEAMQVRLTGEMAEHYDVYYRVHAENFGWLGWAKNGEDAGTAGYGYRLEAMQIVLVDKGGAAPTIAPTSKTDKPFTEKYKDNVKADSLIAYQTHVQNVGWQNYAVDGSDAGTSHQSLRLEGMKIELNNPKYKGDIEYRTHIQNIGWESQWKKNGDMSGTSGQALRLEAMQVRLTGEMAEHYDVYYRVHAENFGWLGWAKNGEESGTARYAYRLEAMQIVLVDKGGAAPNLAPASDTDKVFVQR